VLFLGLNLESGSATRAVIYTLDYETGRVVPVHKFPDGMRISSEVFMSHDASRVVAFAYDADGDNTERFLQVDLAAGSEVGLDLYRGTEWLIPIVPGRRPGEEYEIDVLHAPLESVIGQLGGLIWSPDLSRFAFTMGVPGGTIDRNNNAQIYLVEWGETSAVPLALSAPGNDVGYGAAWSPSGRYISYVQGFIEEATWAIDLEDPSSATGVVDEVGGENAQWLPGQDVILYSEFDEILASVAVPSGATVVYAESPHLLGHFVTYDLLGPTDSGKGYFVWERNWYGEGSAPGEGRILFLDLVTGGPHSMLEGGEFTAALPFLHEPWLWLLYSGPVVGTVVAAPAGDVIARSGESLSLRIPLEELERQFGPEGYSRVLSPDMQLAALVHNGRLMIWDVLTGEYTEVAPELEGEKTFIGWIPDPDAWEATLAAGAP
jgi:hypothetical protein